MRLLGFFFFKQKTAYEMRISDWSSDVCSSDLLRAEMDDAIDVTAAQGGFEPFPIGEILVEHAQVAALRDDARDPGALHGGIVIIVEIVPADQGLTAPEQQIGRAS